MPNGETKRGTLGRRLAEARAVLVFERMWPIAVAALVLAALFLALAWFGLWLVLPHAVRAAGVLLFAAIYVALAFVALRSRLPGRRDALARLDRDSGLPHRPISSSQDVLADPDADPATRALWDLHRRRLDAALDRLRVAPPSPRLVERDRYALRAGALLLLVAAAFAAGPERAGRLAAAFDWRGRGEAGAGFRLDSWIDPPAYTGKPPVVLSASGAPEIGAAAAIGGEPRRIAAPVGSAVVVRSAGEGRVEVTVDSGLKPAPPPAAASATSAVPGASAGPGASATPAPSAAGRTVPTAATSGEERRFVLDGDGHLTVKRDGEPVAAYDIHAIPDRPPTIALDGRPARNVRGSLTLRYTIDDDYGAVGAQALFSAPVVGGKPVTGHVLVQPPKVDLALPAAPGGLGKGETTADLADSPWAGATVTLELTARDEGGNIGRSAPSSVVLPQRRFTQPLARALVEQRRDLVLDPEGRDRIDTALDALTLAPDLFDMPPAVFLGLRTAKTRLDAAGTDADLLGVADLLWAMALQIEDGDMSDTERDLKAIQGELKDAIARHAPPDEIRKLTQALRQQLDKFLAEMARKADPAERADGRPPDARSRTVTPQQLQAMIDRMEQAARNGDMAEAQALLDQLRGVLDNLKTAKRRSNGQQQAQRQMNQAMSDLDRLTHDQQALRDQTFKQGRQGRKANPEAEGDEEDAQGNDAQQGEQQPGADGQPMQGQGGQQAQGQDGGQGEGGQPGQSGAGQGSGDLQDRQTGLRGKLGQLQKQMRDMGLDGEKGFDAAGQAMKDAEGALGGGPGGNDRAVEAQGRALRGLQQGAQGLARQMAQGQGQGEGQQQSQDGEDGQGPEDGTGGPDGQRTDPLGRPRASRSLAEGTNEDLRNGLGAGLAARARQVLEELRRRLGDPSRPQIEQDYLERLLKRY